MLIIFRELSINLVPHGNLFSPVDYFMSTRNLSIDLDSIVKYWSSVPVGAIKYCRCNEWSISLPRILKSKYGSKVWNCMPRICWLIQFLKRSICTNHIDGCRQIHAFTAIHKAHNCQATRQTTINHAVYMANTCVSVTPSCTHVTLWCVHVTPPGAQGPGPILAPLSIDHRARTTDYQRNQPQHRRGHSQASPRCLRRWSLLQGELQVICFPQGSTLGPLFRGRLEDIWTQVLLSMLLFPWY